MVIIRSDDDFYAKRKNRNFWLAICLVGFILMIFFVTIAKLSTGEMIEGFDHTLRTSISKE